MSTEQRTGEDGGEAEQTCLEVKRTQQSLEEALNEAVSELEAL